MKEIIKFVTKKFPKHKKSTSHVWRDTGSVSIEFEAIINHYIR